MQVTRRFQLPELIVPPECDQTQKQYGAGEIFKGRAVQIDPCGDGQSELLHDRAKKEYIDDQAHRRFEEAFDATGKFVGYMQRQPREKFGY